MTERSIRPLDDALAKPRTAPDAGDRAYYVIGITDILAPIHLAAYESTDITFEIFNYGDADTP